MTKRSKLFLAAFLVGGLTALLVSKNSNTLHPQTDKELAKASVMVTRMDGRSGGSGVILSSGPQGSEVLTNAHVCGVVKNGGKLTTGNEVGNVVSYKISELHDLCLISTKTNFNVSTSVALRQSEPFTNAIVTGHPALFPTVITRGHFSKYLYIQIMVGTRPCTEEEANGEMGMACLFLGGMPIIKQYESQLVSATIMPGSSGSPVFNENGEIGGLVFAGSGELSYGLIVPQEYIKNFVDNEVSKLTAQVPDNSIDLAELLHNNRNRKSDIQKFLEQCNTIEVTEKVKELCNTLSRSIVQE